MFVCLNQDFALAYKWQGHHIGRQPSAANFYFGFVARLHPFGYTRHTDGYAHSRRHRATGDHPFALACAYFHMLAHDTTVAQAYTDHDFVGSYTFQGFTTDDISIGILHGNGPA